MNTHNHMPAGGPGQHNQHNHIAPAIPNYPQQSRRQQQEFAPQPPYHHHVQPQSPLHHPYANFHPAQYYPHPNPAPQPYPPVQWRPAYLPPQQYMPPPPPPPQQQVPFQPRSPMVVTSQVYNPSMTPVTRQTPVPPPPQPQPPYQVVPSPRPVPQHIPQQQVPAPAAPPSPAPTPKQEQEPQEVIPPPQEREATPPPQPAPVQARRQSSAHAATKMPFYPALPWHSHPEQPFPPRASRRRRRRQNQHLRDAEPVTLVGRDANTEEVSQQQTSEQSGEEPASETSTIAAASEPETPATSHAPSESDFSQISTSDETVKAAVTSPVKAAPMPSHGRRDTKSAIAVPIIPGFNRPKPSPPAAGAKASRSLNQEQSTPTSENSTPVIASEVQAEANETKDEASTRATPSPKPAPKSWADLVKRNAPASLASGSQSNGVMVNGSSLPKSASLADALKQYSVQIDAKLSFLEPRGLVNTGNMCYMNSILQVLVFCVPFYNFLDQVRQRTVHSMKSDTPLVDAMIMFMKEFRVLASGESVDVLNMLLTPQQLEQFGEPVTPEYVYDAIRKLDRFNSMRRGHQQDAEEFLGFLLEGLHDECVAVMRGQTQEAVEENGVMSPTSVTSPTSADGWFEVGPKQRAAITRTAGNQEAPSPITKIFGGHLRSELRVPGNQQSVTLEPYKPLQLDIGAPHVNNIIDALKGLTRTETLTGDFGGRSPSAKKQVFIDSLPPVLILHLKRFQYDNNANGTQKIWKKVGYPLELEIPKEVFQPSKRGGLAVKGGLPKYRLISVVYHHGKSAAGGHYTVDVLREDSREWIRMDDTFIRRIRAEDVAEGGAEEDPKILAKALEQHRADLELQKQRNMYQGLDDAEREPEVEQPWSEVNGHAPGHKKWGSVANTGTGASTPVGSTGKKTPVAKKEGVRDSKVAYILLYERMRS